MHSKCSFCRKDKFLFGTSTERLWFQINVLGLVGSPRKGSNTDLLVSAVLCGASAAGHKVDKIYLYDVDILPCFDCCGCKKDEFRCVLTDGMEKTYPKLELADAFVCGTPLYWYGPSAKTKLLIDRLRPYISSGLLRGKKAVLVIPSEEGREACRFAVGMFRLSFKYLGIKLEEIVLPKASERSEIKKKPHVLDEAFAVGKSLK